MQHWLADVFSHPDSAGLAMIAAKTAVIYIFLIAGLRLLGKRELGQMTIYDLVLIIVIANSVQNAMLGTDNSLGGGVIAATTLLILNRVFTFAVGKSRRLRHLMIGEPLIILNQGKLMAERMKREGITREQIMAALREHGMSKIEDVHLAVLEVDGTISVVPQGAGVYRTRHHYRALRLQ